MRITKYKTALNNDKVLTLVKESAQNYDAINAITSPADVATIINAVFDLANASEEHLIMLALDNKNKIVGAFEVSHGTLAMSPVHPREIYKKALLCNAASIIIAHNHPSGDLTPSSSDTDATRRIAGAGELLEIPLFDHLIISNSGHTSLKESGVF